jgi:glycerophosphoryl diester phosphodiesterase
MAEEDSCDCHPSGVSAGAIEAAGDSGMRSLCIGLALFASMMAMPASAESGRISEIRDRLQHANRWRDHVMVVVHRAGGMEAGRTKFPENSIAGVRHAISIGAEMVEIDLQKSHDGVYVVFHDTGLNRSTTCVGELAERTVAELKTCRLVTEGTGAVTSETVPTLAEMLSVTKDNILVNIDNKLEPEDLPKIVEVARGLGMADQLVIKANLFNDERVAALRGLVETAGQGVIFMPIIADDAVRDTGLLERFSGAFAPDAVELINWRGDGGMTRDGGPLFGTRARAVAIRGDWHIWVNTYGIVNKAGGFLSGGRGDELATLAGVPEEAYGFWVDRGATMIQTDEPTAAIEWLEKNGFRVPYGLTN